jgi:hypothetical protein
MMRAVTHGNSNTISILGLVVRESGSKLICCGFGGRWYTRRTTAEPGEYKDVYLHANGYWMTICEIARKKYDDPAERDMPLYIQRLVIHPDNTATVGQFSDSDKAQMVVEALEYGRGVIFLEEE